jgi:excisionase family DNA binding protein
MAIKRRGSQKKSSADKKEQESVESEVQPIEEIAKEIGVVDSVEEEVPVDVVDLDDEPEVECSLPKKDLFRPDEVADYLMISKSTVYLWVDHGILQAEKIKGTIRIPRKSIVNCRMAAKLKLIR